jgi:hypothetical protein
MNPIIERAGTPDIACSVLLDIALPQFVAINKPNHNR